MGRAPGKLESPVYDDMIDYCEGMTKKLSVIHRLVKDSLVKPAADKVRNLTQYNFI